jgi:hypothetical protein
LPPTNGGNCPTGKDSLVPDPTQICLFDGFKADKLYMLIYPAKNPIVMGLGYAVTRDIGSFLRYESHDDAGNSSQKYLKFSDQAMWLSSSVG